MDKVLYPQVGYTKAEVIHYYLQVAPVLLPHVSDRPMTRLRFPDGVGDGAFSFYEKNAPQGCPDWVRTQPVRVSDGIVDYVVADESATIVWLANLAALEMHVPQWRISTATADADGAITLPEELPRPGEPLADLVVVDLDPGDGVTMIETARAALLVAHELAADGLVPCVKTSGSKGLQVYAAIQPSRSAEVSGYVQTVGRTLVRRHPDLFVVTMAIAARAGRVFVDFSQNHAAKNTIAAYSLRGRATPSVATPVTWDEIGGVSGPDDLRFSPQAVLDRIAEHGDLMAELLEPDRPPLPQRE
nr:non-homologous end-joining DNA ligase [Microlunatus panaciterrae]